MTHITFADAALHFQFAEFVFKVLVYMFVVVLGRWLLASFNLAHAVFELEVARLAVAAVTVSTLDWSPQNAVARVAHVQLPLLV